MSHNRPRILVIDDEPQIHRFLMPALEAAGFDPLRADTAEAGLRDLARLAPDAVVLDLGLPDMDGKDVLQKARQFYHGPVVVLSARQRESEKIDVLDLGADDYVEKPFGIGEFLARLRAALRRVNQSASGQEVVTAGDLEIDPGMRLVRRAGKPVRLTRKEFDLLNALVRAGGKVVTHRQLLTDVWGPAHGDDLAYLRVFIRQLRQKLETDPQSPRHVTTEPGVGYRFMADP